MAHLTKRILWLSRHAPLEEQYRELERIFGDIEVVVKMVEIKHSQEVKDLIEKVNAAEIVVVLPNNLIEGLIKLGVKPIRAIMDRQMQTDGSAKFSHVKFVKVLDMKIEMEEL